MNDGDNILSLLEGTSDSVLHVIGRGLVNLNEDCCLDVAAHGQESLCQETGATSVLHQALSVGEERKVFDVVFKNIEALLGGLYSS